MKPQLIYIASPYSKGDCAVNLREQLLAANEIMDWGHIPFAPNLSFFYHMMQPRPYEHWLTMDLHIIDRCDFLVRLGGESPGGDRELAHALERGIPTARSLAELWQRLKDKEARISESRILYPE